MAATKVSASDLAEHIRNTGNEIVKQLKLEISELAKTITVQLTEINIAIEEIKKTLSMLTPATKKPIKKQADDETDEEASTAMPAPKKTAAPKAAAAKRTTAKRTAAAKAAAANAETAEVLAATEKPEEAQAGSAEEPAAKKAAAAPKKAPAKRTGGAKKTAAAKKSAAAPTKEESAEDASDEPVAVAKAAAPKKTAAKKTAAKASPVVPATVPAYFKQKYVEDEKFRDTYALPEVLVDLVNDPNYTKLEDDHEKFKYEANKVYTHISKNDKLLLGKVKTEYEHAKAAAKPEAEQLNEEPFSDEE